MISTSIFVDMDLKNVAHEGSFPETGSILGKKLTIGAVSYLNTKPLIYGFEQGMMNDQVELVIDYPAKIADDLVAGNIDIGLVPVAILSKMKEYHIVGNYGIASDGPVASVCLFSEVPLEEITTVLLDYQSRTSVQLVKILLKEYWKKEVLFEAAGEDFINNIKGTTAAVVIGDRAFEQRKISPFMYDLGEAWKNLTGLPFVFAAWVSSRKMGDSFIREFDTAIEFGLNRLDTIIQKNPYPVYDLEKYYTQNIKFHIGEVQQAVIQLFLDKIKLYS